MIKPSHLESHYMSNSRAFHTANMDRKPSQNRKYPAKDVKLLWGLAAGRCAFPECRQLCVAEGTTADDAAIIGKIAHIVAHSDEGPRANPAIPIDERDKYENWILLCPTHHDLVDFQAKTFTVENLHEWKKNHEDWVHESLKNTISKVTFHELEMVTDSIIHSPMPDGKLVGFTLTNPKDKMLKNGLSNRIYHQLTLGLVKAQEVQRFVEHTSTLNPVFPEKLKSGFLAEYKKLIDAGIQGDALFEALHEFAAPSHKSFEQRSAGLAVIAYLFEKCDLFEP